MIIDILFCRDVVGIILVNVGELFRIAFVELDV